METGMLSHGELGPAIMMANQWKSFWSKIYIKNCVKKWAPSSETMEWLKWW